MAETRLPISVCIISANEAHRIGAALKSVAGWTSEIIVVLNDTVSDGTDKIAETFGAKVFREPWKGHIAQKNSAAAKASCEWILGLDTDEVISPELAAEIQRAFANPSLNQSAALSFPRCSFYCGRWIRHGDWYPDRQTRLWRRGQAEWGGVDPHDKLIVRGAVKKLKSNLQHFSNQSVNAHIQKVIPFTDEFVRQHSGRGAGSSFAGLWVRPIWRFIRAYFLRLGFLDGWQGCYIAWLNAFSTASKYAKMREQELNSPRHQ